MAILPYERSLVKRLSDKPFVLVGVNNDSDRDTLKKLQEEENIPWRSWWDGPAGPIATAWGVDGHPSFFILDTRGVIRDSFAGMPRDRKELEKAIQRVLDRSEGKAGSEP